MRKIIFIFCIVSIAQLYGMDKEISVINRASVKRCAHRQRIFTELEKTAQLINDMAITIKENKELKGKALKDLLLQRHKEKLTHENARALLHVAARLNFNEALQVAAHYLVAENIAPVIFTSDSNNPIQKELDKQRYFAATDKWRWAPFSHCRFSIRELFEHQCIEKDANYFSSKDNLVFINSLDGLTLLSSKNDEFTCRNGYIKQLRAEDFSNHRQLTRLNLSCNEITDIAPLITALPYLKDLNVSQNKIKQVPESLIIRLSALTSLDISHNPIKIKSISREEIIKISVLKGLCIKW